MLIRSRALIAAIAFVVLAVTARGDGIVTTGTSASAIVNACSATNGQILYDNAGVCAGETTITAAQHPALTGDVTTPLGSVATTVVQASGVFTFLSGAKLAVRTVTAAGAVTVATTDIAVCINKTVSAATAANLFATPATGSFIIIKDCKGDGATNNITVTPAAGNIDGAGTFVINSNYGVWRGVYTGAAWSTM